MTDTPTASEVADLQLRLSGFDSLIEIAESYAETANEVAAALAALQAENEKLAERLEDTRRSQILALRNERTATEGLQYRVRELERLRDDWISLDAKATAEIATLRSWLEAAEKFIEYVRHHRRDDKAARLLAAYDATCKESA